MTQRRTSIFVSLLALLILIQPALALEPSKPNDEVILRRLVDYLQREKDRPVWPGYDLTAQNLVYGIGNTYYLLSATKATAARIDGEAIPALSGVKRLDATTVQRLQLGTDHVWDDKQVAGEQVFVVKQIAQAKTAETLDPIHEFLTFLHENFHVTIQNGFMTRFGKGDERLLDARDFAYTQLEASLLARLLDEANPKKLREGVQLYLAVRETHEKLVPKAYADYRQGMTATEGTAQYLTDKFFKSSHPTGTKNHIAYSIPRLKATLLETQEADRSRYYAMGAAACHLLDRLMPRWKERFSTYVDSLDGLLAETVDYQHRPKETMRQLAGRYGVEQALSRYAAQYRKIAKAMAKEIAEVLKAYRQQGRSHLSLKLPPFEEAAQGGKWAESWDLPDDRQLNRVKLFEVSQRKTGEAVVSLTNGIYISKEASGRTIVELYRNLEPGEIRLNGRALSTEAATGSLEIAQEGFLVRAREATVKRKPHGFDIDILKP